MKNNEEMLKKFPTMKTLGGAEKKAEKAEKAVQEEAKAEEKNDFSKVKIEPLFEEMVILIHSANLISEL